MIFTLVSRNFCAYMQLRACATLGAEYSKIIKMASCLVAGRIPCCVARVVVTAYPTLIL